MNFKFHLYIIVETTKQICKTIFSHDISRETLFQILTLDIVSANPFSPVYLRKEPKNQFFLTLATHF